jgi:DNA-binding response OmpR family regulator
MNATQRVLIVDDDRAIQEFLKMALRDEGYEVVTASDGQDALKLVRKYQPRLILLDKRMPNMDGRAFVEAYREIEGPHAPIILLTAGRTAAESLTDFHVDAFLAKPFDLNELLELVSQYAV